MACTPETVHFSPFHYAAVSLIAVNAYLFEREEPTETLLHFCKLAVKVVIMNVILI